MITAEIRTAGHPLPLAYQHIIAKNGENIVETIQTIAYLLGKNPTTYILN